MTDILRQYGRYFIGDRYADDFAQGLLALERDWRGPLLANEGVETTLAAVPGPGARRASPADLKNWRFQQALYRAYYDAYVRHRLIHETELEAQAMERLRQAPARSGASPRWQPPKRAGPRRCGTGQRRIGARGSSSWPRPCSRASACNSACAQYQAIAVDRGASLDTLDYPLNNRRLAARTSSPRIRRLPTEPERLKAIDEIARWTDPGPGGFYDDLGNPARQPHLVRGPGFSEDPGCLRLARARISRKTSWWTNRRKRPASPRRLSWMDHAEVLYETPAPNALHRARPRPRITACAWCMAETIPSARCAWSPTKRSRSTRSWPSPYPSSAWTLPCPRRPPPRAS